MVVVVVAAVRLESAFFFCSLTICLSPTQSSDQSDSWGEGCRAHFAQNGYGGPHLLHVLQVNGIVGLVVVFTLGLAVIGIVLVVVVTVALAEDNGAHKFAGLFALGGANLLTFNFLTLDLPFFYLFSLGLLGKGLFM